MSKETGHGMIVMKKKFGLDHLIAAIVVHVDLEHGEHQCAGVNGG